MNAHAHPVPLQLQGPGLQGPGLHPALQHAFHAMPSTNGPTALSSLQPPAAQGHMHNGGGEGGGGGGGGLAMPPGVKPPSPNALGATGLSGGHGVMDR